MRAVPKGKGWKLKAERCKGKTARENSEGINRCLADEPGMAVYFVPKTLQWSLL